MMYSYPQVKFTSPSLLPVPACLSLFWGVCLPVLLLWKMERGARVHAVGWCVASSCAVSGVGESLLCSACSVRTPHPQYSRSFPKLVRLMWSLFRDSLAAGPLCAHGEG